MRFKASQIVSAVSLVAITHLLFFWLISTSSANFVSVYPFYTLLTVAHTALLVYICNKYKYPACFAAALSGSIITVGEVVAALLLGILCNSLRTIIFVQAIIIIAYVLVMAIFIGIAAKESVDSTNRDAPIRPYATNPTPSASVTPTQKRMPKATLEN